MAIILGTLFLVIGAFILAVVHHQSKEGIPISCRLLATGLAFAGVGLVVVLGAVR